MRLKRLALALGSWASLAAAQVPALPPPPDAGQVLRDVQPAPGFTAPQAAPLRRAEPQVNVADKDEARVQVASITFIGNHALPTTELQPLVASLIGAEQTLSQLNAAARRITEHYRARGYLVARAYLPAQDITHGTVTIGIIEGRMASLKINNQSRLSDAQAQAYLGQVGVAGEVIQSQQLNRGLLLLQDTPGVGGARAALQPGASVGTSDLLVELDPAQAYAASVEADNQGGRSTGQNRLGASLALNSPLGRGDLLSLRALSSGPNLSYARLAYQLPLGVSGLKLGTAYADTRYQLGAEFAALQAHGSARSSSVYASYPFVRRQDANLSGTLTLEDKQLLDQTDASLSRVDKQVKLWSLGLVGNRQDAWGGGGQVVFELALASGRLGMDASSAAQDAASAQSQGTFSKLSYTLSRLQSLSETHSVLLSLNGQRASKNLNSSEKFSLGGATGVRAYPQGEGSGDQGWLFKMELYRPLTAQLQGLLFFDAGSVAVNHTPFAAGDNSRTVTGLGLGLNGQWGRLQFKTALAWSTGGGDARSEPVGASRSPRLWVQISSVL